MKEDVAKKWIEELRSGRHKQGKSRLRCEDGSMCCLGVLQGPVLGMQIEREIDLKPLAQLEAGMKSRTGLYYEDGNCRYLSDRNDQGMTFEQIADMIEARWPEL